MNFTERYGPGGLSWMSDLLSGDVSVVLGASGSVLKSAIENSEPLVSALVSVFDPSASERYPIAAEDVVNAFREISTLSNIAKGWYVWNTGQLLTRNEVVVSDVDSNLAAFIALTGMEPQDATDVWLKRNAMQDYRAAKNELVQEARKHWDRAMRAAAQGDLDSFKQHRKNATVILMGADLSPVEKGQILRSWMTTGDTRTLVEKTDRDFLRQSPDSQRQDRFTNYRSRIEQLR